MVIPRHDSRANPWKNAGYLDAIALGPSLIGNKTMKVKILCIFLMLPLVLQAAGNEPTVKYYLKVLKDEKAPVRDRATAVDFLVEKKERAAIPLFVKVLPGRYDLLALRIIVGLGEFAEPKTLPALEKYLEDAAENKIVIPGRILGALLRAMEACMKAKMKMMD